MIKIIELADLHLNPKWIDAQKPCIDIIIDTVKTGKPDFVCIAGDLTDVAFYNSENSRFPELINFLQTLLNHTKVVMIPGTKSHDVPGSYAIYQNMGCAVLDPQNPQIINDVLFIGLPEIDKTQIMAKKKFNPTEAIVYINSVVNRYITDYWTPIRELHKDKPCIFLGHGVFVDDINKPGIVALNSDHVIDNNILKEIKADRYIFGHIHQDSESKILNGGYVGFMGYDRDPWGSAGFRPGFNLTEIDFYTVHLTKTIRIHYPVIRKEKIKIKFDELSKIYNKISVEFVMCDVRIKLEISKSDLLKIDIQALQEKYKTEYNLHSCEIKPDIIREETTRITPEQAEKYHTVSDRYCLYKDWDPEKLTENQLPIISKLQTLQDTVMKNTYHFEKKVIELLSVTVHGSIFSETGQGKTTLYHNFENDLPGLWLIFGENGKCKSTFMGLTTPYPVFVGFQKFLKDIFILDDSYIEKNFRINGVRHQHKIFIKKNKVEYYWNVEKEDKFEVFFKSTSQRDFMVKCEEIFGPIDTFISTCFFCQEPHRNKYTSSLSGATPIELRDAYMNIVGISREEEKEFAKLKRDELKSGIEKLESEKVMYNNFIADDETVKAEKLKLQNEIKVLDSEIEKITAELSVKNDEFKTAEIENEINKKLELQILNLSETKINYENKIKSIDMKLSEYAGIDIDEIKVKVKKNDELKSELEAVREKWQKVNNANKEIQDDIECNRAAVRDCENKIFYFNNGIDKFNTSNKNLKREIELLTKPCFNCGKIDPDNERAIDGFNKTIINNKTNIENLKKEIQQYTELKTEHETHIKTESAKLQTEKLTELQTQGNNLKSQIASPETIESLKQKLENYKNIDLLNGQKTEYLKSIDETRLSISKINQQLNPFIEETYNIIKFELQILQNNKSLTEIQRSKKAGLIESIEKQLEKNTEYKNKIKKVTVKLDENKIELSDWETIYTDMQASKYPAFELDLMAADIDARVNVKLAGKFIIKTITQDIGTKGDVIDRFNILVYDPENGKEKPMLDFSVGERTWFDETISQVLREKRQELQNIIFTWSFSDEVDKAVQHNMIQDYYDIVKESLGENHTRYVVSHNPVAENCIENKIDVLSIGCDLREVPGYEGT